MTNSYKNSSSYAWYDQTFVLSRAMTCQQNGARLSITMVGFMPHLIKIKATSSKPFIKFLYFYLFLWIDWRRFLFVEKKTILIWSIVLTKHISASECGKLSWFLFLEHAGSRVKVVLHPRLDWAAELIKCQADTWSKLQTIYKYKMTVNLLFQLPGWYLAQDLNNTFSTGLFH